ncbi:MAG: hypothetical protein QM484_05085 [Woeseiaceae bacterium]
MKKIINALVIGLMSFSCYAETPQITRMNATTGAVTWELHAHGVHFSLTQILVEQAQAFYINRGFTLKQITPYSSSCIYMAVLRNDTAPGTIHFIRDNWSILVDEKPHLLISVNEWVQRFTTKNIKKSALIAFRWAQFPVEQEYEPGGDWNQGMLSVGLPPESKFDVIARWDIDGKVNEITLQGIQCAK